MSEINSACGNKAKLFAKVAQVMTEVRRLKKDGQNTFDKYAYITGDSAFERIGGAMAAAGLVMIPSIVEVATKEVQNKSGGIMFFTTVRGQITLADAETGETWTSEWPGEGSDRGDKSINKALTAMMKYFLLRVFQVGSGEDADADSMEATGQKTAVVINKPQPRQASAVQHRQPAQRRDPDPVKVAESAMAGPGMADGSTELAEVNPFHVGEAASPSFKRFHAEVTKTYGKQADDARHWLIERYTGKITPRNVRSSSNDLSNDELDVLTDALVEKRAYYQKEFKAAGVPAAVGK